MTLRGIKKHFPGTKALDWKESDELEIKSGEILGLVGENGAGKSTLFQVIMGIYSKTAGSMTLFDESAPEGRPYEPKNVHDAEDEGIAIIMQQPNFAKNISVSENIFLGQSEKFKNRAGLINWKKQNAAADELLEKFGISHIKSTDILSRLSYEDTKLVEITRALSGNPRILLVDETSAAVSKDSVEKLYSLIRKQRDEGCAVIYISHFIASLGFLSIARALVTMISGGTITMIDYNGPIKQIFGLRPWILVIAIGLFVIVWIIEKYTLFGRRTRLVGGDENVARLSGVNVKRQKVLVFMFAGFFAALGGIIMAARIGSGSPSVGEGYELDVITAVVLGGTAQVGGVGGVRGTLVGVLTIQMLANGLVLWGMPSEVQLLIKGIVVILAVAVSTERTRNMVVK